MLPSLLSSSQAGFYGSVIATLAVILPSFLIILLVTALLKTALNNQYVQAVLRGLKPCVIGIMLATGIYLIGTNCFGAVSAIKVNLQAILITILLAASMFGYKRYAKKKLSPIGLIVLSAIFGIVIF